MENSELKNTEWKASVRKFQRKGVSTPLCDDVTIPEKGYSINMGGFPDTQYGRAIDANYAVKFIYDLISACDKAIGRVDLENLEKDQLREGYKVAQDFIISLRDINYGVTIDKNFALKLLSQTGCEGLRGYICYKDGQQNEAPFSVVVVGVDGKGYDLNYNDAKVTPPAIPQNKGNEKAGEAYDGPTPSVDDVEMASLTGEYMSPPYSFVDSKKDDEHFKLLNIARRGVQAIEPRK